MNKPLALDLARKLTDSRVPLPERANLARQLRGSDLARLIAPLTVTLALLPKQKSES